MSAAPPMPTVRAILRCGGLSVSSTVPPRPSGRRVRQQTRQPSEAIRHDANGLNDFHGVEILNRSDAMTPDKRLWMAIILGPIAASLTTGGIVVWLTRPGGGGAAPAPRTAEPTTTKPIVKANAKPQPAPDCSRWELAKTMPWEFGDGMCVAFSPDNRTVAVGGGTDRVEPTPRGYGEGFQTGAIKLLDVITGAVKLTLTEPKDRIDAVAFYPDGSGLVACDRRRTRVYDTMTGAMKLLVPASGDSIAINARKKIFVTSHGMAFWDMLTGEGKGFQNIGSMDWPAFSSDGTLFFTNHKLWNLQTEEKLGEWRYPRAAFSHDSKFLGMTDTVWNIQTRSPLWSDPPRSTHPFETAGLAFSPDDRFLIIAKFDGEIRIRASATGHLVNQFRASKNLADMAISSDGRWLATAGPGEPVSLWRSALRDAQ